MEPPLGQNIGEVVTQSLRGGNTTIPVGGDTGDVDGPALEHGEVRTWQPEDLSDDLYGEVEGELLDQVRPPGAGETVDELVDHALDKVAFPSFEDLRTEGRRHQGPMQPVLGLVHLEDGPAHDRAHDPFVDRRRERLIVPEDLDRLVESENGDRGRHGRIHFVGSIAEVDRTDVNRALSAHLGHPRIRIPDVAGNRVLELKGSNGSTDSTWSVDSPRCVDIGSLPLPDPPERGHFLPNLIWSC